MIEGRHVILRMIERQDLELIRRWRNNPQNYEFFANRDFISDVQQENWYQTKGVSKDVLRMMILEKKKKTPIGITHFEDINFRNRNASWGIYIAETKYRVRIYASEAVLLLFDYGFKYLITPKGQSSTGRARG